MTLLDEPIGTTSSDWVRILRHLPASSVEEVVSAFLDADDWAVPRRELRRAIRGAGLQRREHKFLRFIERRAAKARRGKRKDKRTPKKPRPAPKTTPKRPPSPYKRDTPRDATEQQPGWLLPALLEDRTSIHSVLGYGPGDTGSPEVQIALLTARIAELTEHLKENRNDNASRRGLQQMVGKRKNQLRYLYGQDVVRYRYVVYALGIRGLASHR